SGWPLAVRTVPESGPALKACDLHAVGDGIVPETVQALQGAVHLLELLGIDAADLLDRTDVTVIEARDDLGDLLPLRRQAHPHRTAVDTRTLVVDEAQIDQLLQIVRHVRAEIVTARAQFARRQFGRTDIEEQ